ncbi:unnamed protein product [Prorocentrum cordatum]|uniref:Uncharacterized protein n=1 Tax=Prorocentrum cordatum TaxID=2364126 RepID=A0ABN9RNP2_9DINO|nr:unnamed protein product [Polarella glacialis]
MTTSWAPRGPGRMDGLAPELAYPSAEELAEAIRSRIPGPDVLAVTPDNILSYCCGNWALVEKDIVAVLPQALARPSGRASAEVQLAEVQPAAASTAPTPGLPRTVLDLLGTLAVREAFRVREELVNYKKVLLHVHQRGLDVERRLAQLASFFHEERERCDGGFSRPSERRAKITDARMECKGRCEATYDARLLGKALCGLPRHPSSAAGAARLAALLAARRGCAAARRGVLGRARAAGPGRRRTERTQRLLDALLASGGRRGPGGAAVAAACARVRAHGAAVPRRGQGLAREGRAADGAAGTGGPVPKLPIRLASGPNL